MKKSVMSQQEMELMRQEIEVLKLCQHPNIVRLYDVFESTEHIHLTMELFEGGDLLAYLDRKEFKIPERKAAEMTHSLATALFYLHSYGIIHRDLKPDNVMLANKREDAELKIVDFGLSKIIGPSQLCTESCGTLTYAAPEVILKKPYGFSADVWSLGVIAYLLLAGELPFNDYNDAQLIKHAILFYSQSLV
jgi:serine/threonine protein kinase